MLKGLGLLPSRVVGQTKRCMATKAKTNRGLVFMKPGEVEVKEIPYPVLALDSTGQNGAMAICTFFFRQPCEK